MNKPTTCWTQSQKASADSPRTVARSGVPKEGSACTRPSPRNCCIPKCSFPPPRCSGSCSAAFTTSAILFPPSHCPHCNQRLRFWELIPVLSYLLLRGQCARCHKPIHIRYPLVELLSGLTSGLLAWRFGPTLAFPVYLVFTGMLIVASGIDLECFILPDGITLGGTVLAVPAAIFALGMDWTDALLGGLVGGGTFLAVLLVFKRLRGVDGMGFGDVKLMLMLGVLCGPLGLPLITLVAGVSALAAFLLIACLMPREAPLREMPIPFGPFLSLGAFVHILAGQEILDWWIRFITG